MIDFSLFSKEDLKILFEGFETSFLQEPFKHSTKSLSRFIPRGFRVDRLTRPQMVNVFSDAIMAGHRSIYTYVSTEIETQFEKSGITVFIESQKENQDNLYGAGFGTVTNLLWKNHLHLPAYIVYLLFGITSSASFKEESLLIHKAFCSEMEAYGKYRYKEGVTKGEQKSQSALEAELKRVERLEKSLSLSREQKEEVIAQNNTLNKEREDALSLVETNKEIIKEKSEIIDKLEKELSQRSFMIKNLEDNIAKGKEIEGKLERKQQECLEKDAQIESLLIELSKAKELAYSEEVLEQLCAEVLDELNAISLGKQEILKIAKKRFSENETVFSGWERLSEESNGLVKIIIEQLKESVS